MEDNWKGEYEYFTVQEMSCKCGCGLLPRHSLMVSLVKLRQRVGPLEVTSGARCPAYNSKVSNTGIDGPHTQLLAVDLKVSHAKAIKCIIYAYELGFRGFGVSQKGTSRFLHLDFVPGRGEGILWSY